MKFTNVQSKYQSELVEWSDTLSCGVPIINEQHKELLKLTNDLFNHCSGTPSEEADYFGSVIRNAVTYVKEHFATEERMMIATKFKGYSAHKLEHDRFTLTVIESVKAYDETKKVNLLDFTRFLKDWILSHIAFSDKQYFDYFKSIAVRGEDGKLHITKDCIVQ
jgi:hemerythrin